LVPQTFSIGLVPDCLANIASGFADVRYLGQEQTCPASAARSEKTQMRHQPFSTRWLLRNISRTFPVMNTLV
jgi:hypothetical protein